MEKTTLGMPLAREPIPASAEGNSCTNPMLTVSLLILLLLGGRCCCFRALAESIGGRPHGYIDSKIKSSSSDLGGASRFL
jgi:hypothetical protein